MNPFFSNNNRLLIFVAYLEPFLNNKDGMCLFLLLCADGPEFVGLAHIILNLEGGQTFAST